MKFALNRYNIDFHAVITDPPPIAGAQIEELMFGLPPLRSGLFGRWTFVTLLKSLSS